MTNNMTQDQKTDPTADPFDAVWRCLETRGSCDSIGGMEYDRVRREWYFAGKPIDIEGFISRRANIGPETLSS